MERVRVSVLGVILCILCARAGGAVIYVDPAGVDAVGGGSVETPFGTIQYALDLAATGDTVVLNPGTYTGAGNYDLTPRGKDVHIRSIDPNDAGVVAATIVNPGAQGRGFSFVDGESAACVLEGVAVTGGRAARGGAIYCINSSPTITRCVLTANTATLQGGAMYLDGSNTVVRESVITANTSSTDGGGIEGKYSGFTAANCLICGNVANGQGAGIAVVSSAGASIVNCTVAGNQASFDGGGIYLWNSSADVTNCIVWNNTGTNGQIGLNSTSTSAIVVCSSDIQGGYEGEGNIDSDPLFVGLGASQTAYYDYHLLSEWGRYDVVTGSWVHDAATSPCIDAGDSTASYSMEPWPHGGRVNMGAFGATVQASMSGSPADFNIDGAVDWRDIAELADHWLEEGTAGIYNLDGIGRVDMKDAAIFMQYWRWQR